MRLVFMESNDAWVVKFGEQTVAIGGTTFFSDRESAVVEIGKRNLVVTEDGEIVKAGEASISTTEDEPEEEPEEAVSTPVDEPVEERPKRRVRPKAETPEEAAERRREQNKISAQQRPDERKREVLARNRDWWREHPEEVAEYRKRLNANRRERYRTDPEYRAKVSATNKAYRERKRAEQEASS